MEQLEAQVASLDARLGAMEDAHARVVELESSWQDWQHKIRNVLARLNRRADREESEMAGANGARREINPAARKLLGI